MKIFSSFEIILYIKEQMHFHPGFYTVYPASNKRSGKNKKKLQKMTTDFCPAVAQKSIKCRRK